MTALFRPIKRMLSPRENERGRGNDDDTVPGTTGQHTNSDMDSVIVDNVIYSEPTPLDRVPPRLGSGSGDDPPLPPRPLSANASEHETYYQAPIDTLGRGNVDQQQQQQRSPSTRDRDRERAQERETKQMVMHTKTLSQKEKQCAPVTQGAGNGDSGAVGGHRRTRSGGHVIDNEEYSTPWNVQEMQQRRSSGAPPKAPRAKKSGAGKPIPCTPSDGSDNIIPVSPNAILSSHHERSQSASPLPPRSPGLGATEPEYDDPWDVKNRRINKFIPNQHGRHHAHSVHDRHSPPPSHLVGESRATRQSVGGRIEHHHLEEVRPTRAMSERNHNKSTGALEGTEAFRPRTITDVHSHGLTPNSPRTNSVSMLPHSIQKRPLPEEPGNSSSTGLPSPSSIPIRREPSPSPSTWFDCQLALEEQTWYHGAITRAEAEAVLANKRDFSFLVRNSESCRTDYSLSIRDRASGFIHLRIVYERSGYVLGQFSSHFQTVPECIFFYTQQRLNIRGTEHKKLRYPVSRDRYRET